MLHTLKVNMGPTRVLPSRKTVRRPSFVRKTNTTKRRSRRHRGRRSHRNPSGGTELHRFASLRKKLKRVASRSRSRVEQKRRRSLKLNRGVSAMKKTAVVAALFILLAISKKFGMQKSFLGFAQKLKDGQELGIKALLGAYTSLEKLMPKLRRWQMINAESAFRAVDTLSCFLEACIGVVMDKFAEKLWLRGFYKMWATYTINQKIKVVSSFMKRNPTIEAKAKISVGDYSKAFQECYAKSPKILILEAWDEL